MRNVHEGRKDFECPECGKKFKQLQSLKGKFSSLVESYTCRVVITKNVTRSLLFQLYRKIMKSFSDRRDFITADR